MMGFSIDYGFGPLGALVIVLAISAGIIVMVWGFSVVRLARRDAIEHDPDHDGPDL